MRKTKTDILRDVIAAAEMKNADFDGDTVFIKDKTRLYREAWIIAPLRELLERAEADRATKKVDRQRRRGR